MHAERPVSAVLSDILGNVQNIIHAEMRLAKTEVSEQVGNASSAILWLALGAAMLFFCAQFALVAVVIGLSEVVPAWAAATIVAAFEGVIAAVLVGVGIHKLRATRALPKTRATIKENVEWAKEQTR